MGGRRHEFCYEWRASAGGAGGQRLESSCDDDDDSERSRLAFRGVATMTIKCLCFSSACVVRPLVGSVGCELLQADRQWGCLRPTVALGHDTARAHVIVVGRALASTSPSRPV